MEMKYEKYLMMSDVPAGKILEVILSRKNISQKELADMSNEYPQRIHDYIKKGNANSTSKPLCLLREP